MNFQYHIHESSIKCPYCDCECHNDDYTIDQDQSEFECDSCGKTFWAEMNFVYSTYSDCELNGKEHDYEQASETHPTLYSCKNCYQYKVEVVPEKTA